MTKLLIVLVFIITMPNIIFAYNPPVYAPLDINSVFLKQSTISFYENNVLNSGLIIGQTYISNNLSSNLTSDMSENSLELISTKLKVSSLRDFIKNSVLQQVILNNNNIDRTNSMTGDDSIYNISTTPEVILDINNFTDEEILDIKQRFMSINIYLNINNKINTSTIEAFNFIKDIHNDLTPENQIKSTTLDYFYNLTNKYFADISDAYLMLTNKTLALKHNYIPENIRQVNVNSNKRITLEDETALATEQMFAKAKSDGINLMLISGYRDFEYQNVLFNNKVNSVGFNEANQVVALPGESEHQTGYVIDVSSAGVSYGLVEAFENTKEFEWLEQNASDFGFILRYPKDKINITNYTYEPWHYRYIGDIEIATFISNHNLTLEEYHKIYYSKNVYNTFNIE